ncbi:alcohol oxidase, partial [Conidiobolus coronatus NRRL 28638]
YDYIVVGAGPAGSMVATELAKAGYYTLLMDAGNDKINANTTTPGLMLRTWEDDSIAWQYYVNYYNENSNIRKNTRYPRSSGLGGCSLHNAMVHLYPKQQDFDEMVRLTGDESWSESTFRKYYESILEGSNSKRSFLSLSTIALQKIFGFDSKYKGLSTLVGKAFTNKLKGVDPNGYTYDSSLLNPIPKRKLTIDDNIQFFKPSNIKFTNGVGKRYGVHEYVKTVLGQTPKLHFKGDALVTKVILQGNKATGVEYMSGEHLYRASPVSDKSSKSHPKTFRIRARKEVIISGGVFNSPQILMLSGIGNSEHLKSLNIEPKVNLPGVGKNLHDHYEVVVNVKLDSNWEMVKSCKFKSEDSDECWKKYKNGDGPYNTAGYFFGEAFKSKANPPNSDLYHFSVITRWKGYSNSTTEDALRNFDHFGIITQLPHQVNRKGAITLKSSDPRDTPNINFNYFEDGADKDIPKLIDGIRDARKKLALTGWRNMIEVDPGKHVQSDEQLEKYIRENTYGHHACCSNKIGRDNDPEAVLDKNFKVRGVENLRVVDQSSIPAIWGNFPVLSTYLLGVKGADAIL